MHTRGRGEINYVALGQCDYWISILSPCKQNCFKAYRQCDDGRELIYAIELSIR